MIGNVDIIQADSTPENYLLCDGSTLNILNYPDLFSVIGIRYGGDGETTFKIPNIGAVSDNLNHYIQYAGA